MPSITLPTTSGWLPPGSNDTIRVDYTHNLPPTQFSIVLQSSPAVTYWKGVELHDATGNIIGADETYDTNHGPVSMMIDLTGVPNPTFNLIFLKAEFFGVHTGRYCASNVGVLPGQTATFTWQADSSIPPATCLDQPVALPTTSGGVIQTDQDKIQVDYVQDLRPTHLGIVLKTASNVTWWKGVEVQRGDGNIVGADYTENTNHGPVAVDIDTTKVYAASGLRLVLFKAKTFVYVHTSMYCVANLTPLLGVTTTFTWLAD